MCHTHTHNITNRHDTTAPTRPRHETQQTFMSISPSNRSEEVRPLMMINRCQTKNSMRESCKSTLTLYTEALDPMEQATKHCHCGNKHVPPYEGPTKLLGMSKHIYLIQGSFTLPCIPFFIPFISTICQQGLCTNKGTDIDTHWQKKSPSFSFTSQLHWAYPFTNP